MPDPVKCSHCHHPQLPPYTFGTNARGERYCSWACRDALVPPAQTGLGLFWPESLLDVEESKS